jgi:hypothetical protein
MQQADTQLLDSNNAVVAYGQNLSTAGREKMTHQVLAIFTSHSNAFHWVVEKVEKARVFFRCVETVGKGFVELEFNECARGCAVGAVGVVQRNVSVRI